MHPSPPPGSPSGPSTASPGKILLLGLIYGAVGGIAFGYWMLPDFARGATFKPIETISLLRSLSAAIGPNATFIACCATLFAGVGFVTSWRLRWALTRQRDREAFRP